MYQLSTSQTQAVSGGYLQFVTQEWKDKQAHMGGQLYGGVFGLCGLMIGAAAGFSPHSEYKPLIVAPIFMTLGAVICGTIGYGMGYSASWMDNVFLENNTWYEFTYY